MTALRRRTIMELEKNTRRYVIICNSDYVRVNGLYNDSRAKPRLPRNIRN